MSLPSVSGKESQGLGIRDYVSREKQTAVSWHTFLGKASKDKYFGFIFDVFSIQCGHGFTWGE